MGTFPNASSLDSPVAKCHLGFTSSIWPCVEAGGHQNHFSCDTLVEMEICEAVFGICCLGSSNNSKSAPSKSIALTSSGDTEWRWYRPIKEESLKVGLQFCLKVSGGNLLGTRASALEGLDKSSEAW